MGTSVRSSHSVVVRAERQPPQHKMAELGLKKKEIDGIVCMLKTLFKPLLSSIFPPGTTKCLSIFVFPGVLLNDKIVGPYGFLFPQHLQTPVFIPSVPFENLRTHATACC